MPDPLDVILCREISIIFSEFIFSINVFSCQGKLDHFSLSLNNKLGMTVFTDEIAIGMTYNKNELNSYLHIKNTDVLSIYHKKWKEVLDKFIDNYDEKTAKEIAEFIAMTAKEIASNYAMFLPIIALGPLLDEAEQAVKEKDVFIYDMRWR